MTSEPSLRDELQVYWSDDNGTRDISPYWAFGDGRVFGGYSAALALAAACDRTGLPAILSSHTMFAEALRPGPADLAVDVVRRGRSAAAVRVAVSQAGRACLVTQVWLAQEAPASADLQVPQFAGVDVTAAPALRWRAERFPFMGILEERVLSYPGAFGESAGPPRVELWCRPRAEKVRSDGDGLYAQLADVLLFDAHMLDSVLWSHPDLVGRTATLDLAITWFEPFASEQWRALSAETGAALGGFATTTGQLRDEQGRLRATATSQGRVMHRRTH